MSAVMTVRLTGDALLAYVQEHKDATKTEQCIGAGYVRDNGKPAYVDFYTELLNASPIQTDTNKSDADDAEYNALDEDKQALYDEVHDRFGEKWDHKQIMEFMSELDDLGITTEAQLSDAYTYSTFAWRPEREFAEHFITDVCCESIPEVIYHAVDWQSVWDHQLSYDFSTIEFDGDTYFFSNHF